MRKLLLSLLLIASPVVAADALPRAVEFVITQKNADGTPYLPARYELLVDSKRLVLSDKPSFIVDLTAFTGKKIALTGVVYSNSGEPSDPSLPINLDLTKPSAPRVRVIVQISGTANLVLE